MGALAWLVASELAEVLDRPAAWPRAIVLVLAAGLVWQFLLVVVLVRREQGSRTGAARAGDAPPA
jgi:hypothetical protein